MFNKYAIGKVNLHAEVLKKIQLQANAIKVVDNGAETPIQLGLYELQNGKISVLSTDGMLGAAVKAPAKLVKGVFNFGKKLIGKGADAKDKIAMQLCKVCEVQHTDEPCVESEDFKQYVAIAYTGTDLMDANVGDIKVYGFAVIRPRGIKRRLSAHGLAAPSEKHVLVPLLPPKRMDAPSFRSWEANHEHFKKILNTLDETDGVIVDGSEKSTLNYIHKSGKPILPDQQFDLIMEITTVCVMKNMLNLLEDLLIKACLCVQPLNTTPAITMGFSTLVNGNFVDSSYLTEAVRKLYFDGPYGVAAMHYETDDEGETVYEWEWHANKHGYIAPIFILVPPDHEDILKDILVQPVESHVVGQAQIDRTELEQTISQELKKDGVNVANVPQNVSNTDEDTLKQVQDAIGDAVPVVITVTLQFDGQLKANSNEQVKFAARYSPSLEVRHLKEKLANISGRGLGVVNNIKFMLEGKEIFDGQSLSDSGVKDGSTIIASWRSDNTQVNHQMVNISVDVIFRGPWSQLNISKEDERKMSGKYSPSMQVRQLKEALGREIGAQANDLTFTLDGKEIFDGQSLSESGVKDGSVVIATTWKPDGSTLNDKVRGELDNILRDRINFLAKVKAFLDEIGNKATTSEHKSKLNHFAGALTAQIGIMTAVNHWDEFKPYGSAGWFYRKELADKMKAALEAVEKANVQLPAQNVVTPAPIQVTTPAPVQVTTPAPIQPVVTSAPTTPVVPGGLPASMFYNAPIVNTSQVTSPIPATLQHMMTNGPQSAKSTIATPQVNTTPQAATTPVLPVGLPASMFYNAPIATTSQVTSPVPANLQYMISGPKSAKNSAPVSAASQVSPQSTRYDAFRQHLAQNKDLSDEQRALIMSLAVQGVINPDIPTAQPSGFFQTLFN